MKGIRFLGKEKVEIIDSPDPQPGYREVVVRMKASAVCRSDLAMYHGVSVLDREMTVKVIPGHEACGVVERLGEGIAPDEIRAGDRVAIYLALGCGHCELCLQGWRILCPTWKCLGFDIDGGHAELIRVPCENCLRLPPEMSFVAGALSTDKFGGLYHCHKVLGTSGRDTTALFGAGPMGQMGIVCAKALGATVIAVDTRESRLLQAKTAGADFLVNSSETNPEQAIMQITRGKGADTAIDCSGNPAAQNSALACVKKMGKIGFIGESKSTTINPSDQFLRKMLTVTGNWYFPVWEYGEITDFIVRHGIVLEKYVSNTFLLQEAQTAYEQFDAYRTGIIVFTDTR